MRLIPLFAVCALLVSCHGNGGENNAGKKARLSLSSIFNPDSVKWVAANTGGKSNAAEKEFLKAIDIYRNQKNPAGSIEKFKKAILLQPQAKSYYELGNALLDSRNAADAIHAYEMAELLDYKPLSKLLYNKACAFSVYQNKDSAKYYLLAAIEFGYNNLNNVLKDPDLEFVRTEMPGFKSAVMEAFSGAGDPEKLEWNLYATQFKPLTMPLTIDKAYAKELGENFISYDFEMYVAEMRDAKFSRDVGSSFYYVGEVKKTTDFKTLIYAISDAYMAEDEKLTDVPCYYYMVSYTNSGKLIDKILVAGQQKYDGPFRKAVIAGGGDIELTDYKIEYEKDPEKDGFKDNPEKSRTEIKKETFVVTADGHFSPKTQQLALNK